MSIIDEMAREIEGVDYVGGTYRYQARAAAAVVAKRLRDIIDQHYGDDSDRVEAVRKFAVLLAELEGT